MSLWRIAAALLTIGPVGTPQGLAPEVLLLSRIKRHLRDELAHVPNYTCLETVSRFLDDPGSHPRAHGQLMPLDTVRLEIVYSDHREWYGSPGARNLSVNDPVAFIFAGMMGSGAFASILNNVIEGGIFTYRGQETLGDRKAVRYDFRLPRLLGALEISLQGGRGTVGEEGSLWVDPQSLDLVRLESRASEIPPYLPLEEASTNVTYARMRIGEYDALLAQQADSHMLEASGVESYNRLDFTHCRAYSARSEISFGAEPQGPPQPAESSSIPSANRAGPAVPPFLRIAVQLTTPVSNKDAVGTRIEGKVSGDVLHKGKIVVPDGSAIRGRIRRLERNSEGDAFIVGLEFTEVEVQGASLPFYADFLSIDKDPRIQPALTEPVPIGRKVGTRTITATITLPELAGLASFFVKGASFTLPSGFQMVWRTRGLIQGADSDKR